MTDEIILHLSAGQGPRECEWLMSELVRLWAREAAALGLTCEPVEPLAGPTQSFLLRVSGRDAEVFAAARTGTIRWIGISPFRPLHKRRNWFVGVTRVAVDERIADLREADIRYQTLRASGPGGQHVNRTESAVRATHLPTGIATVSQDQRSQFSNKRIARLKLTMLLEERRQEREADGKRAQWTQNRALERGNAVLTYEGVRFVVR